MGSWLTTDTQPEAEARLRRLDDELKLEKDNKLGLGDKGGRCRKGLFRSHFFYGGREVCLHLSVYPCVSIHVL